MGGNGEGCEGEGGEGMGAVRMRVRVRVGVEGEGEGGDEVEGRGEGEGTLLVFLSLSLLQYPHTPPPLPPLIILPFWATLGRVNCTCNTHTLSLPDTQVNCIAVVFCWCSSLPPCRPPSNQSNLSFLP